MISSPRSSTHTTSKGFNPMHGFNGRFDSARFDREFNRMERQGRWFSGIVAGIIALGFLFVIVTTLLRVTGALPDRTKARAEGLAVGYATNVHGWPNPYAQCAGIDTDNNGYVTCMISNRAGATEQIECADQGLSSRMNNICRPYRTINIVNSGENLQ